MPLTSFSVIRENMEHYQKCHEILELPESLEYTSLRVEFGSGDPGLVTLVIIPSGEQVAALAMLAINHVSDGVLRDD